MGCGSSSAAKPASQPNVAAAPPAAGAAAGSAAAPALASNKADEAKEEKKGGGRGASCIVRPKEWDDPEYYYNELDNVFERFSGKDKLLNRKEMRNLVSSCVDHFIEMYEEQVQSQHRNLSPDEVKSRVRTDVYEHNLLPGKNKEEVVRRVTERFMKDMDLSGDGNISAGEFRMRWRKSHNDIFGLPENSTEVTGCTIA